MGRVVHFEIHAAEPERAAKFYTELLGWKITKWDGPMEYWMVVTGPDSEMGINGGLLKQPGEPAGAGACPKAFVCTATVENLDESLAKAESLGATPAVPKMQIPGVGWLAYVHDTEGNVVGLLQPDMTGK